MSKHSVWPQILAVLVATTTAAVGLPETGFSDDGTDTARSAATTSGDETFEYMLVPFHHTNFKNIRKFEDWLDDLGAAGWVSILHIPAVDPKDHQRIFMRRVGGSSLVVDYEIEKYRLSVMDSVEKWVPEYDRLGKQGKYPVWFFDQGGKTYVVTEARTLDGVFQTLSWEKMLAGKSRDVGPAEFKRAANKLAKDAYVPIQIGFSADQSDYFVVGFAETTPGRLSTVKLKFGKAKLSTPPNKWLRLINKKAKRGYHLAEVELADNTGTNFIVVFAQVKINGVVTRRECVVEPILTNDLERMVERLNSRGAAGYEEIIVTFAGGFDSFQFILCMDK